MVRANTGVLERATCERTGSGMGGQEQVEGPSRRVLEIPYTCFKANAGTRRNYSSQTQHAEAVLK